MNSEAIEPTDSDLRQQRYREALEGTDLSDIPESIADDFIQGDFGCQEVMLAHVQITRFIEELVCGENPLNTEVHGVNMGLFWTMQWFIESQARFADFEAVRTKMISEGAK